MTNEKLTIANVLDAISVFSFGKALSLDYIEYSNKCKCRDYRHNKFGLHHVWVYKSLWSNEQRVLCDLLKRLRVERGWKQAELAERLDIKARTRVSDVERGERLLDMVALRQWVAAFDLTLPAFVDMYEAELAKHPKYSPEVSEKP